MTSPGNTTTAKRAFAVTVAGIAGQFAGFTGGDTTADVSENWNGGADAPDITAGRKKKGNITVRRPFNPTRDRPVIAKFEKMTGSWSTTIVKQDLDANDMKVGRPKTYTGCLLVRVQEPEYDAAASDGAMFEMEFRPSNST